MLVRPGDSVEDCAEVVAEGVIPLDTILYGKEFQTQQVDPVTGEHSIHVRCAELKLIPTQSWKKYLNENFDSDNTKIGATLMIGVVDDGHVDHFKLSSLLSARSHRRQHTYTLRVNGTPSGGSSLYCDGAPSDDPDAIKSVDDKDAANPPNIVVVSFPVPTNVMLLRVIPSVVSNSPPASSVQLDVI